MRQQRANEWKTKKYLKLAEQQIDFVRQEELDQEAHGKGEIKWWDWKVATATNLGIASLRHGDGLPKQQVGGADRQEYANAAGARRNARETDSGGARIERWSTREIDEEALPPHRAAAAQDREGPR
jgi:hypothetical protein